MKYFILLNLVFSTFNLYAQNASAPAVNVTTSESAMNDKLIENAAAARKAQQASQANSPQQEPINFMGKKLVDPKSNLTDQEKQLSEQYVDQGEANRIIQAKCVGEMAQACNGMPVEHKTLGLSPGMMKLATQAYASFGAIGDFLPMSAPKKVATTDSKESPATDKATADKKDEKPTDYCKYIPAMTEMVAKFTQEANVSSMSQQLNNGADTSQKESLLKAAKSHDSRAEQAQMQAAGWLGGAACYAYKGLVAGDFATDTSYWVKLGSSAFLGTFYQLEVGANKEYAQKTRDIANALPSKGACNPVTETLCYCAEPEHLNDTNYCKAQIAARAASANGFTNVACTDSQLKLDPTCSCTKNNSCFDRVLQNGGIADIQMGMSSVGSPFKSLGALARGRLEPGLLSAQTMTAMSAIAKKALAENSSKVPNSNLNLTAAQKEIADAAISKGIPTNVARLMATNSPSADALNAAKAKMGSAVGGYQIASAGSGRSNILDFSGGSGLGIGGKKAESKSGVEDILGKLNPKSNNQGNSKILEFAQKAEALAPQITKSDRPIFEIISIRYQTSGRRLLQIDSKN